MSDHDKFNPDVATASHHMYPPPHTQQPPPYQGPQYQGPPPTGYGIYPDHASPHFVQTTYGPHGQQTTVLGGGGVTYVNAGPAVVSGGVATVVVPAALGTRPTPTMCRSCQANIITRVDTRPTCRTHLCAVLLCVLFCWPCVCVPYCMDSCMSAEHYCPNCNAYIGSSY